MDGATGKRLLLRKPCLNVIDMALDCGFSASRYFAGSFKSSTGLTPTAYRKRFKDAG